MDNFDCQKIIFYENEKAVSIVFRNRREISKIIFRLICAMFNMFGPAGVPIRLNSLSVIKR